MAIEDEGHERIISGGSYNYNEGVGVLVPDSITKDIIERELGDGISYWISQKEASSVQEEVKCGVSSCLAYDENYKENCSTFYSGDITRCKRFTQAREEEVIEEVVDGGSDAGKIRKIYF